VTIDLDLRSEEQVRRTFGEIHGVQEISMPRECKEAFGLGLSSTTAYAQQQIEKHGLAQFVKFQSGDFRQMPGKFDLVFRMCCTNPMKSGKTWPPSQRRSNPEASLPLTT
jgi:hypothetical protein